MENLNKIEEFVETPTDGYYLSKDIEFKNECRKNYSRDIVNPTFDFIQSITSKLKRNCYLGSGIARVGGFDNINWNGKHR